MSAPTTVAVPSAAAIAAAVSAETSQPDQAESTMLAVTQHRYGSADALSLERIKRPEIASDEVLVEVAAAGLDRGVVHLMTGLPYLIRLLGYGLLRPKNPVLGLDVSGRVAEVGSAVTRFEIGDEVMGIAKGSFADYAAADEAKLVKKPSNTSFDAAAVSTVSGITALQALTTEGSVTEGERVLVIGASGGVGTFAVQIASALGARVTGVASGGKVESVRSLGAHDVLDYNTTDLGDLDREFDLIIDIGGRNPIRKLRRLLIPTGRLVIVGGEDGGRVAGGIGRQLRATVVSVFVKQRLGFFIGDESGQYIQALADLLASGEVIPVIGRRFALDEAGAAIRELEAGHVFGKALIEVSSS